VTKMSHEQKLRGFEREIESWKIRIKDANDRKTYDEVFDRQTLLAIYKLFSDGFFDILDFPISTGKEGNVFRGITRAGDYVAVKIYRLSTSTFRDLGKYILGDPRFKKAAKRFPQIIFSWAQKEYSNLERFSKAGVRVPEPIAVHRNVLVMEYIGNEYMPAPKMKDVVLEDPNATAEYLLESVKNAYSRGHIVHGDMSEYNVLMTEDAPVIIDLAQAVVLDHWMSQELLERDVSNLARFFRKAGVMIDEKEQLGRIRGGETATS